MKAEEYIRAPRRIDGWKVHIVTYRIGDRITAPSTTSTPARGSLAPRARARKPRRCDPEGEKVPGANPQVPCHKLARLSRLYSTELAERCRTVRFRNQRKCGKYMFELLR